MTNVHSIFGTWGVDKFGHAIKLSDKWGDNFTKSNARANVIATFRFVFKLKFVITVRPKEYR